MNLYCPSCGEESEIEPFEQIAPGIFLEKCPACQTVWKILVEFYEVLENRRVSIGLKGEKDG